MVAFYGEEAIATLAILAVALAVDLALGEPPRLIHPVVWVGRVASFLERRSVASRPLAQFACGCGITLLTIGLFVAPAWVILFYLKGLSSVAYVIVGALLFKYTFSVQELRRTALRVKGLLIKDKLDEACFELRALVGRDTRQLPVPLLVSATVESVAENTCDSFVAPLFYFVLLGVPGAIAYRVVNTLDSMLGYHGEYEYLGKFAGRLDDVLNFVPARLTALLLVLAALLSGKNAAGSWRVVCRDHANTESPNAGWSMAAVAGALKVQLAKVGHYRLGQADAPLAPQTIDDALVLMRIAVLAWVAICCIAGVSYFAVTA